MVDENADPEWDDPVEAFDPSTSAFASEIAERDRRIRALLERHSASALILGRRENFAWATAGGDAKLQLSSEHAVGMLVITVDAKMLVAYEMDCDRLLDEQCGGQSIEPIRLAWSDGGLVDRALSCAGSGRVLCDLALPGTTPVEMHDLYYPLTDVDGRRLRWMGALADRVVAQVARELTPGVAEREVAANMAAVFMAAHVDVDESMVGFDSRLDRYRHFMPTAVALDRYALLHPTISRWGLHISMTRSVHFGSPPADLRRRFDACAAVEADSILASRPGVTFRTIHQRRTELYADLGFGGEEQRHFQGGLTGYSLYDPAYITRPDDHIVDGCALDWFTSVPGAKTEDAVLVHDGGPEVLSATGAWPVRSGSPIGQPDLMVL